jgi:ribonuclease HII
MADNRKLYCGLDEAGRGSVMGSLVVGAVFVENDDVLSEIGVKDSKKLTPKKRESMYDMIAESVPYWTVIVTTAEEIDEQRKEISLNDIELRMFKEAALSHDCRTVYADCPDINESSFTNRLYESLGKDVEVIAKHKADDTYLVVSAASIMAKVTRDRIMDAIREEFGMDVGSGYPSDHYTMDFIREWIGKNNKAPAHVRCSWEPVRQMLSKRAMTKLTDW